MLRRLLATHCVLLGLVSTVIEAQAAVPCVGDCNGDVRVTVDELLQGVAITLGSKPVDVCREFDRDDDGSIGISDVLAAVNATLAGCLPVEPPTSTAPPSSTPTTSPTASPTGSPTPSVTPSATANLPPVLSLPGSYRTFVGYEIDFPIGAQDPEGSTLACLATDLPEGATFDDGTRSFRWTPSQHQIGPFYVPLSCADDGTPPATGDGEIAIHVSPSHPCLTPECDPTHGCVASLAAVETPCCRPDSAPRVPELDLGCPEGRSVLIGRNTQGGFGRLQNCDNLRIVNFAQVGAEVRFHVSARCLNASQRIQVQARLETQHRLAVDARLSNGAQFHVQEDGSLEARTLRFPVNPPSPFFDLQNSEANLTVTLTDVDGVTASHSVRVVTTFTPVPDLPD